EAGVDGVATRLRSALAASGSNLLLLVDQFEELFTYRRRTAAANAEAADFVALLSGLAEEPDLPVFIVITMRSDHLGECDAFLGFPELLNRGLYLVPRLCRAELRECIVGPARLFGRDIAPRLVDTLLNDLGAEQDQLPVLQHALMRMWSQLDAGSGQPIDLQDYRNIGTLAHALSKHGDEALAVLSVAEQERARRMFARMTESDTENRRKRHPERFGALLDLTGASPAELSHLIEVFRADGRAFVRLSDTPPRRESVVDISHEALIRQWRWLSESIDREVADRDRYTRLREGAALWRDGKGDLLATIASESASDWWHKARPTAAWAARYGGDFESVAAFVRASAAKHRRARRWRVLAATLVTGGALLALSWFSFRQWGIAQQQREMAVEKAQQQETRLEQARSNVEQAREQQKLVERAAVTAYSEDRGWLASLTDQGVSVLNANRRDAPVVIDGTRAATALALSADGALIAVASDTRLELWTIAGTRRLWSTSGHEAPIRKLAISPDGTLLASASEDRTCRIWDMQSGAQVAVLKGYQSPVIDVVFDASGKRVIATGSDGLVKQWESESGTFRDDDRSKAQTLAQAVEPARPTITAFVASAVEQSRLDAIDDGLERLGLDVQLPQLVTAPDEAPAASSLQYFHAADRADAEAFAAALRRDGLALEPVFVDQWAEIQQLDYGDPKPRRWETWNDRGSFELWFAAGEPDTWFPVVASIVDLPAALARADEVQQAIGRDIAVAVYRARDRSGASTYAVTLGGYMREALAHERAAQARSAGLARDAYARRSADWGSDLRPTRTEQRLIELALQRHAGTRRELTPETPLADALAVAPAQVAKAVIALARDEGIALDERQLAGVFTIRQLAGMLDYRQRKAAGAPPPRGTSAKAR
ncbi:MAG: WD40 repeat domain-containing protein, partial [Gammaproteobacteria bacterium]